MLRDLFKKKKYITVPSNRPLGQTIDKGEDVNSNVLDGMWIKCAKCGKGIYRKDFEEGMKICPSCGFHFRLSAYERLQITVDKGSFIEFDGNLISTNILNFPDYDKKLNESKSKSGLKEAVITGYAKINDNEVLIGIMDSNFMMGSMGSAVGEKVVRLFEKAIKEKLPVIIFTASGGARMQEGMLSLMQMAKTSSVIKKHSDLGLLYVTVLTDPTTGGVTASFAMLGDITIAEKGALIGFAGRRVIEQTIREKLPEDFQSAEFLLKHGFTDMVVERSNIRGTLDNILRLHRGEKIV